MDSLTTLDTMTLALVSTVLALLALLTMAIVLFRQRRLLKRYKQLLNGPVGTDLESLLVTQQEQIANLDVQLAALQQQVEQMGLNARLHVQKTATVRFNAFPDTGSDLSFAIALLDANDNGVVISSLYGRSESRIYAKPIDGGKSTYILSDEEKQAIAKATGLKTPNR